MMRLLDLFCGAGGAAMGYYRAGFEVVGVDINPQPRYPFEFHQADALEYMAEHGHKFDAIHASPPCQRYSEATPAGYKEAHPDLIEPVRGLLRETGLPWVIENVAGARSMLPASLMLCGTMFGLPIWRHRYFEMAGLWLMSPKTCAHNGRPVVVNPGSNARKGRGDMAPRHVTDDYREAMGIPWMTGAELTEAIPPAYTEYIGKHLMRVLETG